MKDSRKRKMNREDRKLKWVDWVKRKLKKKKILVPQIKEQQADKVKIFLIFRQQLMWKL